MEVSRQLHVPAVIPPAKEPHYKLSWMLSGLQSRSRCGGEENKSCHCPRQELNPGGPFRLPLSKLTLMSRRKSISYFQ